MRSYKRLNLACSTFIATNQVSCISKSCEMTDNGGKSKKARLADTSHRISDPQFSNGSEPSQSMEVHCLQTGRRPQRPRRVIDKSGERNISFSNLPQRSKRYIQDFVTTIIETRWRIVISAYLFIAFGCWIIFAMAWYLISYAHNDLEFDVESGNPLHEGDMPCVEGATNYVEFFLLSFEIQTTIGFGERFPNEECPEAVFLFVAQIVFGIAIDGTLIGIIYAKLTRPSRKPYDLKFSRKAVICQRDSKHCLMFRVCDPNEIHIIDSRVQACLFGEISSNNGDILNQFQYPLKLQDNGRVHIIMPVIVCHVIDRKSPLYNLSAPQFLEKRFEIIVTFTGASASTGQTTEERTSYLSREIAWGHRFVNMTEYKAESEKYFVDYDKFDVIEEVDTPLCSAQRFDEISEKVKNHFRKDSHSSNI
ncbi:ATP-sensitive inward rectifier potassium channel 11-like [Contarinia nasturtii]|uniref:ATP-sensitive inward rectifier potassium channel 11-like n=1 Tax=Contarinia nasturtii TaxID=265458 RepID=UPI0012D378D8|nr:ATP-sensitive inward rectifier potassium channel 11-like [Contarinia nasturtii]